MSKERDRILCELDIDAARRLDPALRSLSDEGIIVGMHKARLNLSSIPMSYRKESLDWLRKYGFKDYGGGPLPDQVPDSAH